ncbi:uncharacterized protein LOC127277859 [Leptopilina boulardi]|uniref:uncharacterized protein LOC127277859 n=1 Tax=Leptopilina boulardi TaxID=63433 RepID=UPI0021F5B3AF|nr:uncharacterized protein LOC127277859 [Leptopilina boulardi]
MSGRHKYKRGTKVPRSTEYRERRLREAVREISTDESDSSIELYLNEGNSSSLQEEMVLKESSSESESSTESDGEITGYPIGIEDVIQQDADEQFSTNNLNSSECEMDKMVMEVCSKESSVTEMNTSVNWDDSRMASFIKVVQENIDEDVEEEGAQYDFTTFQTDEEISDTDDEVKSVEEKGQFEYLNTFLDDANFSNSIEVPVNKNIGEVLMMLLQYASANSLSLTAIENLFKLVNCIFLKPIIPETRYLIDKLFNPKHSNTYHALCDNCGKSLGTFTSSDTFKKCDLCNIEVNVKDSSYNNFFVTLDPSNQIADLLEANGDYYDDVMHSSVSKNKIIKNIYDGKLYRRFVKSLNSDDHNRYVTAVFNTDGAPLFESSTFSIWPIYIMLNELPIHVRTNNLIVVGLWFGKTKPDMNVFLDPFVEKMNILGDEGITCTVKNKKQIIKLFCLVCCVDSVARAPIQGLTQFNGKFGCNWCKHPGEWVVNEKKPNSGCSKYPWIDQTGLLRTEKESIRQMKDCTPKKPICGFKNPSVLINLNKFNIINGLVPDNMHIISGVVKQFTTIWLGKKGSSSKILTKLEVDEINTILESTKVPHHVGRLTRSLADKEHWKAREWENFLLYYSAPIMCKFLDKRLMEHWLKLVEAIHILLQSEISIDELNRADQLLHEFVYDTERLYTKVAMTFNVHILLHLARSVLNWGPLYEHSAFAFEAGNAKLLNVVHTSKGVHKQICRHINFNSSYAFLKKKVEPFATFETKNFCSEISTSMVQKTVKHSTARYFGKSSYISSALVDSLNLSDMSGSFKKMIKDGCLYMSSLIQNKRSDNSFAKLKDGTYVQIIYFIADHQNDKEYTVCRKLITQNAFPNQCAFLKKINSVKKKK